MRVLIVLFLVVEMVSIASGQLLQDTFEVKLYNENKTFSFSEIQDVDIDSRGYIWLSMTNHGVMRINQDEGRRFDYEQTGRTRNDVFCFYEDDEQNIFLGRGQGIDQYDFKKDKFSRVAESSFAKAKAYGITVEDILKIPSGKYLVAVKSGVHLLDIEQDTIERFNITGAYKVDGESSDKHVYKLLLDEKRNLVWCTTRSGLMKINLETFETELVACDYHQDGSWPLYLMDEIYMYEDQLFIRYQRNKILSYNISNGDWQIEFSKRFKEYLPSHTRDSFDLYIMPTTSYKDQYLVIPTTRMGLFIYDMKTKQTLKPYLKNEIFHTITKFEDPNCEAHKYASETYFGIIDKHGYLWSSEVREIVLKTKKPIFKETDYVDANNVQISEVLVDNRVVKKEYYQREIDEFVFKKHERDITLSFDLVNPPRDEYELQYAVNGSPFKPCFNKSIAALSQLKGGPNDIVLRAVYDGELLRIKNVKLDIEKYWHEQWTNRFLLLGIMLALFSVMYWVKVRRVKEKAQLESDFNKKIAEVQMAAFRSQMNPHFMFNSLNSINQFIVRMEPKKASEYLSKFSNLMRMVLSNSTSQLVSLEADTEALRLYLDMERLRFGDKFKYEIIIDSALNGKDCMLPPLLIQPYVENAIWHGLMPLEGGGKLTVRVINEEEGIKIAIEDNGIGRVKSIKINQNKIVKSKSLGMQITKNRLDLVERVYDLKTDLKIIDKYDGDQSTGTLVELVMPYLSKQKIKVE